MQSIRRLAMPLRVQQFWNAIENEGIVMDYERLVNTTMTENKLSKKEEVSQELNYALKDKLVMSEVVETPRREETEIYKLPDPSTLDKGDHDWYCFHCHLGGQIVKCEDCPRVYHLECLPEERKPEKDLFVCPACHVVVKQKVLNQLLQYICERFKSWNIETMEKCNGKSWALSSTKNVKDAWRFDVLVHMPMDLEIMMNKATTGKYTSLEEFQVDCETLVHAIGVYFGVDMLKGGQIGQAFIRDALHDIQEIKLCHDCFRKSNEKNHDWWFCLPCSTPHEVVWAKQTGYPYWPAKVMKKDGNKYDVRYFGGNYERGIIDAKNIQPIETSINQLKVRRTALWNDAYDELVKFQDIAKDPDLVAKLPPKGRGGPSSAKAAKTAKRVASQSPEEVITKKSRKSEQTTTATPKTSRKSAATKATPQANGTATSTPTTAGSPVKKKAGVANKSAVAATTPARRDSATGPKAAVATTPAGGSSTKTVKITVAAKEKKPNLNDLADGNLHPDILRFMNELDDNESLDGDAYFSDEESNESQEKVSEDAVSSSCNESKATRSVYVQVAHQGIIKEKLAKKLADMHARQIQEISQNKKKQWCFNCEREAIYHCCWSTAYCSIECQQVHWTREHKRLCRRVRRDRAGTSGTNQGGEDY